LRLLAYSNSEILLLSYDWHADKDSCPFGLRRVRQPGPGPSAEAGHAELGDLRGSLHAISPVLSRA
jgi:hypothetical protein